jgi:uncharacterized delta-60 repeat protein
MKRKLIYAIIILIALLIARKVNAQDGQLDMSFADSGKVINSIGSTADIGWSGEAHSTLIQSDGKIIAVGFASDGSQTFFALIRYNQNGIIDSTFGINGVDTTAIGYSDDKAYSALIQPDGKIIAAGYATENYLHVFALVRYNKDGSRDNTFGTNGIVTTAVDKSDDKIFSIAIQQDGKIVAAGTSYEGINNQNVYVFALARYNTDGSLDNTFGTKGMVTTALEISGTLQQNNEAKSVIIQNDGKIVIGGYSGSNNQNDFALVRYNSNGSLDNSFNTNGIVVTAVGTESDVINSLVIQSDGKIVTAGFSEIGYYLYAFALARYDTNGSLDNTFGANGIVTTAIEQSSEANSVTIQSDGKIVVTGYSGDGNRDDFALARYNTDGSLDNTFGINGIVTTPFIFSDEANSVAIQTDGKIVAAGACEYNNFYNLYGFALMRYTGSSSSVNSVPVTADLPKTYALYQNYPNPFNPTTILTYSIPKSSFVTIKVYDVIGREVAALVNEEKPAGDYSITFNASNLASGIYFYKMQAGRFEKTKKLILLK